MGAKQMPPSFYLSTIMIMAILLASRILTSSVHPRPIFLFPRLNVSLARSGRSGPANLSYLCMPPEFISVHLFLISQLMHKTYVYFTLEACMFSLNPVFVLCKPDLGSHCCDWYCSLSNRHLGLPSAQLWGRTLMGASASLLMIQLETAYTLFQTSKDDTKLTRLFQEDFPPC